MRQRGDTASAVDQGDRLASVEPGLGDAGWSSVPQVAREHLAHAGRLAGPCQVIGQVAPAQRGARERPLQCLHIDRQPQRLQPGGHRFHSMDSAIAKGRHRRQERGIIFADEVPQKMEFVLVVDAGQLDSRDQLDTPTRGLGPGHRQGRDRVVVGNCQCRQANPCRGDHHLARRTDPVRMRGVHV